MEIAAVTAGLLFAVSKLFDAVTDPVMGFVLDRRGQTASHRSIYLLLGALTCPLAYLMIFRVPDAVGAELMPAYMLGAMLFFAAAFTLFSVPYAGLALARGHLQEGTEAATWHIGYLPPLLLAGTLALRLHAWRRLFDSAYEDGMDEGGALLLELFAGVGAWCAVVCGVAWAPQLREWAFAQPSGGRLVPMPAYTVTLLRLMFVPALISAGVGAALYVRRASRGATTAALVFVLGMATIHAVMLAAFANDGWSMASGVLWSLVLLGFAQHIFRRGVGRSSAWADAAPNVF